MPAASWYETTGVKYTDTKIPCFVFRGQAVTPVGESHDEWAIFALLSKEIQRLAPQIGVTTSRQQLAARSSPLAALDVPARLE